MQGVTTDLHQLVSELDEMLPRGTGYKEGDDIEIIPDRRRFFLPTWAALVLFTAALVGAGWLLLQPLQSTCEFSETVCAVEDLDLDALLATSPEALLFDVLPPVDVLDPNDELTLGDVFDRLDELTELRPEELISPEQFDRLLAPSN